MTAQDTTSSFCGTPEYLGSFKLCSKVTPSAPEVLDTNGYNKDVDWWSLGILLYEMTFGRPPFFHENVNEMYDKILRAPLVFPSNVSVPFELKNLIEGVTSHRVSDVTPAAA
jgi:serum/glucocorticoid-regulated kinase 2